MKYVKSMDIQMPKQKIELLNSTVIYHLMIDL